MNGEEGFRIANIVTVSEINGANLKAGRLEDFECRLDGAATNY
jgi:hypothetical protein